MSGGLRIDFLPTQVIIKPFFFSQLFLTYFVAVYMNKLFLKQKVHEMVGGEWILFTLQIKNPRHLPGSNLGNKTQAR